MEDKKTSKEQQEKVDNFLLEIKKACKYFKLDLMPTLQVTERGIMPALKVIELPEEEEKVVEKK